MIYFFAFTENKLDIENIKIKKNDKIKLKFNFTYFSVERFASFYLSSLS